MNTYWPALNANSFGLNSNFEYPPELYSIETTKNERNYMTWHRSDSSITSS